jgi:hypothetical protein
MQRFGEEARHTFIALNTLRAVRAGRMDPEVVSFSATLHDFRSVLEVLLNRLLIVPFAQTVKVTERDKGALATGLREQRSVGIGTVLSLLKAGKARSNPVEKEFLAWVSQDSARAHLRSGRAREHIEAILGVHLHGINHHPERARQEWPTITEVVERHMYGGMEPEGDGLVQLMRGLPS